MANEFDLNKIFRTGDPRKGEEQSIGQVPNQIEDLTGRFRTSLTPKQYQQLASPGDLQPNTFLEESLHNQVPVAPPWLTLLWDPKKSAWKVTGHEGRQRAAAAHNVFGDRAIPVDFFLRAKHPNSRGGGEIELGQLSPEMEQALKDRRFISQKGVQVREYPELTEEPRSTDLVPLAPEDPLQKKHEWTGKALRGIGSLARKSKKLGLIIQAAQLGWDFLSDDQKKQVTTFLQTPTHKYINYFQQMLRRWIPKQPEEGILSIPDLRGPNTHEDLSLPELITGYAIAPAKIGSTRSDAVTREELVSRLRSDPELQKLSQNALKNLGYEGTIPLFRVALTPEGGFKSEGVVSTSLTPESHLDTIKFFTKGKISPFDDITPRLIRYDVPIEKVIGYLPAFKDRIKRGVNKAVIAKGMGQRALEGFSKVGDPASHAKNLLDKQKEVLVDVTGISPTFMKDFDAQESKETFVDPLSIRMTRIEKIVRGLIKTPEDYRRDMGGNETYFDLEEAGKLFRELGKDRFRQLENEHMQKEIEHYKKFFGKAAGGFVDKPLYQAGGITSFTRNPSGQPSRVGNRFNIPITISLNPSSRPTLHRPWTVSSIPEHSSPLNS